MDRLTRYLIGSAKTAEAARAEAERLLAEHTATFTPDPPGYHLTGPRPLWLDTDEVFDSLSPRTDPARRFWLNQIPPKKVGAGGLTNPGGGG